METFALWHHHYDNDAKEFRFFATAVQTQGLAKGTKEMVAQMLADMGIETGVKGWSMKRVASDYLSEDRDTDDWRDHWMDTGLVSVKTTSAVRHRPSDAGFDSTTAWDETWKGRATPPSTCLVVADFDRERQSSQAEELLGLAGAGRAAEGFAAATHDAFPKVSKRAAADLHAKIGRKRLQITRCHVPRQLHVSISADRDFFDNGADPALAVEAFCQAIGGTTMWRGDD